ncbi:MAG: gamma carbonic anhydrase family protein [Oscillospiraceae bacterium]|nr:gamma carbonic anhydrase family protein [Oscillospiraceae bacterium]
MILEYKGILPEISPDAFVAPSADIIGRVKIAADASVWFGAVIRGDEAPISIGEGSNVQDNAVLHCDHQSPMNIGRNVTVGHGAIVHGATIGDNVLIGMGAVILNGAKIGDNCIVGAGAVVKENADIPADSMLVGVPAKVIRTLDEAAVAERKKQSYYVPLSKNYMEKTEK